MPRDERLSSFAEIERFVGYEAEGGYPRRDIGPKGREISQCPLGIVMRRGPTLIRGTSDIVSLARLRGDSKGQEPGSSQIAWRQSIDDRDRVPGGSESKDWAIGERTGHRFVGSGRE